MRGRSIEVDLKLEVDQEREADLQVEDLHHLAGIGEDHPENEDIAVEAEAEEIEQSHGQDLVKEDLGGADLVQAAETTPVFHLT